MYDKWSGSNLGHKITVPVKFIYLISWAIRVTLVDESALGDRVRSCPLSCRRVCAVHVGMYVAYFTDYVLN